MSDGQRSGNLQEIFSNLKILRKVSNRDWETNITAIVWNLFLAVQKEVRAPYSKVYCPRTTHKDPC